MKINYKSKYAEYQDCEIIVRKYQDGNTRLDLLSPTEGPICTITTTTGHKVPEDMIIVKNYSENEGMVDWLMDAGLIDEIVSIIPSGFVNLPVCHLTDLGIMIVEGEV